MPAATSYDPNSRTIRDAVEAEMRHRRAEIGANREYYNGIQAKPLLDDRDNVVINLCRQVVDETISFLVAGMPKFDLDAALAQKSDLETWLDECWERSGGAALITDMAQNGALTGQIYVRVAPMADGYAQIVNLDPANICTVWSAEDYREILWHELHWSTTNPQGVKDNFRLDIVNRETSWSIIPYKQVGGTWEINGDSAEWFAPIPPVITWQHLPSANLFYGHHELPHRRLNDSINKVASDIQSILRYHAFPTTVGTGFTAGDVEKTSIDGFLTVPATDAKIYNVEMQSDLSASLNTLERLREQFFAQARVVIMRGDPDAFRGITNLGIRTAFMPMIAKTRTLRLQYSKGLAKVSQLCLLLAGKPFLDEPKVRWEDSLPVDMVEQMAVLQQQMAAGLLSKQTASERLGLNYEVEQKQITTETIASGVLMEGQPVGVSDNSQPTRTQNEKQPQ